MNSNIVLNAGKSSKVYDPKPRINRTKRRTSFGCCGKEVRQRNEEVRVAFSYHPWFYFFVPPGGSYPLIAVSLLSHYDSLTSCVIGY